MTEFKSQTNYSNNSPSISLSKKENNGYKCSINIATKNNLYDKNKKIFKGDIISKDVLNDINLYENSDKKKYSLCNKSNDDYYYNCALDHKNIWLTKNSNNKCEINSNITLVPEGFDQNTSNVNTLLKPKPYNILKNLVISDNDNDIICSENWYDWFTIPDYHNGNKYMSEFENGETKCFMPCLFGSVPATSDTSKLTKCINRDLYDNGLIKNTFPFTPLALIILLGSTKKDLKDLYYSEFNYLNNIIENYNNRDDKDYKLELNTKLLDIIKNDDETFDNIFNYLKIIIQKSINNIITEPISHLNIVPPIDLYDNINLEPNNIYTNKFIIEKAYNISNNFNNFLSNPKDMSKKYNLWLDELSEVNNIKNYNSWEFNKLLLLLQSACVNCFSYPSSKDKNYKNLYIYNNYLFDNLSNDYTRIKFPDITQSQILKSLDSSNSFNNFTYDELKEISSSKIKLYQMNNENIYDTEVNKDVSKLNNIDIYKNFDDIISNENIKKKKLIDIIDINLINNSISSKILVYINVFFILLITILYLYLSYNLILLTWSSFSNVINYIIMGIIWTISTLISIFKILTFKITNTKGLIFSIHENAVKYELFYDKLYLEYKKYFSNKKNIVRYVVFFAIISILFILYHSLINL